MWFLELAAVAFIAFYAGAFWAGYKIEKKLGRENLKVLIQQVSATAPQPTP